MNAVDDVFGMTPLAHAAALNGNPEVARVLLRAGGDFGVRPKIGSVSGGHRQVR